MTISKKSFLFNAEEGAADVHSHMSGIKQAIKLAGGACALAHKLGVTHQAVYGWAKRGWTPMQRAMQIEKAYDIPRTELLKPDLVSLLTTQVAK